MNKLPIDVSIIIVNYNTEPLIKDCIESIYKQTSGITFEIIIVDNNSPNGIQELQNDKRIKLIKSKSNLGFGKANNLGAQYANGKYLFLLNPDTLLINNAISILFNYNEENPDVGVCGGNLYTRNLEPCHSYKMIAPGILYEINEFFKGIPSKILLKDHFNNSNQYKKVAYITGADLFINKEIFREIEGFDNDFFMYFEETYLCYEISKLGMKIINVPQAKIIHLESQSFNQLKEKREILYYEGRKLYLNKRYSSQYIRICNFIAKINCMINIAYFSIFSKTDIVHIWRFRLQQLNK